MSSTSGRLEGNKLTMWTLLFLCSVFITHGVQGVDHLLSTWGFETIATTDYTDYTDYTANTDCGGYLYGSNGIFSSPNYPNPYPPNLDCIWYIRPGSKIIQLELSDANTECGYDYIYVYDGSSTGDRLLGRVCKKATFYSTSYYLTVRFRSDHIVSDSGFRATYRVVAGGSCVYNCGYQVGNCSCSSSCQYRGDCCSDYRDQCLSTSAPETSETVTVESSCHYNCGMHMGSCSCTSSCEYYGNCCHDYYYYCPTATTTSENTPTDQPSCRYNCGWDLGTCSCTSSCQYYGNCCYDYYYYCPSTTTWPATTAQPSCRYNCGWDLGSCSCSSSCPYNGNCCNDYDSYCHWNTDMPDTTTGQPSCQYNCGWYMGSCSCSSSCEYQGNCCNDYYSYCQSTTDMPYITAQPSCRYNCGWHMGSCSCSSSCEYQGNCCNDYYSYCQSTFEPTTAQPSCRYNCGWHVGSCSCSSSCEYQGNCCNDYYSYCQSTSEPTTAQPSCRYNCGWHMGSCSCSSSCEYQGNCCNDYYSYCQSTAEPTTAQPSCRYNCGRHMGSCSCSSSCEYYWNCCNDYYSYCQSTAEPTTAQPSCRYNCEMHMGSCSCSSSCEYYGNCCYDYYSYCLATTEEPNTGSCGGNLFGSGNFSSPNHPSYYYDNAYCVWQLRAAYDQRIFLQFTYLQLENCCSCDYIAIYDGPSVGSRYLGKVCNNSLSSFFSSSNYMTVLFHTDGSVVGRGFKAEFMSALQPSEGRVDCSSDNMNIVIERSYLNSLGYDGHSLYLNDPHCRPQVTSYQVVFSFPLNSCGNIREFDNDRIVYTNSLRAYPSNFGEITRQSNLKLNVHCRMEQDSVSQILYVVHEIENTTITGTGRYNTSMAFYTSSSFYYQVTDVPYEVTLNQNLYVQVNLRRGDSSLVLFIDTCVASPSSFDFQTRPYYLVRNGCPIDNTYYAYSTGSSSYARFTFKTFQFLQATNHVYIQCKVLICPASDYNSRCRRGCNKRMTREVGAEHESETLVVGPIKLKDPEEKEDGTDEEKET